jgi:cyclophilin family peptidyl-prolyl cis-trans isomerase
MRNGLVRLRMHVEITACACGFVPTHCLTIPAGLYGKHLPITVSNFRRAVQQGLYTGTIFHKVLPGAFVQVSRVTPVQ